jgi:hypothetical protein
MVALKHMISYFKIPTAAYPNLLGKKALMLLLLKFLQLNYMSEFGSTLTCPSYPHSFIG